MLTWKAIKEMIVNQQFIREKAEIEYKEAKNSVPKDPLAHLFCFC